MTLRRFAFVLFPALALSLAPPAAAQCFLGDDGFDLGCCTPPAPNLPFFPPTTVMADYGALTGCQQLFVIPPFPVQFGAPTFVLCDIALISVNIPLAPGHTISGFLVAKYSRTWMDFSSPVLGQVYRFLVNGDLLCSGGGSTACTTIFPRCAPVNSVVHFDGHIDYSCDPFNPNTFIASFSLNHLQGCVSHAPWSCVPMTGAAGHDEASYHIVGPAPFIFGPGVAPQGAVASESVRSSFFRLLPNFVYSCVSEQKIPNVVGGGLLLTQTSPNCSCAVLDQCSGSPIPCLAPTQCFVEQNLQGMVCCPGPTGFFQSQPFANTPISNTGLLAQSLGSWGGGTLYPGVAHLTVYFGVLNYIDPCAQANWGIHAVVGVGVDGTFLAPYNTSTTCATPIAFGQTTIDLQNVLPINNPNLFPGYGCLSVPDVIWNLTL